MGERVASVQSEEAQQGRLCDTAPRSLPGVAKLVCYTIMAAKPRYAVNLFRYLTLCVVTSFVRVPEAALPSAFQHKHVKLACHDTQCEISEEVHCIRGFAAIIV